MHWDLLIRGAKIFDGSGSDGVVGDIAVKDGVVAARGHNLPQTAAHRVDDAAGAWLIPGLLDIHTHEDLEVELDAGLPEVVRHGTTAVVVRVRSKMRSVEMIVDRPFGIAIVDLDTGEPLFLGQVSNPSK